MKSFIKLKKLKLLSLVISVVTVMLLTVMSVNALDFAYSGTGSNASGGASINGSQKYSLHQNATDGYKPIIGYRFSVLKEDKTSPGGKTVDIYNNSWIAYDGYNYDSMYGVQGQRTKQKWINGGGSYNNSYSTNGWGFNKISSANVGDGGMPHDPTAMRDWLMRNNKANAKAVFVKCGFAEEQIKNDYYLVIEPIVQCRIDNKPTATTNTELAVCGGKTYGYNTQGRGANTAYDGTFKFISFRVCNQFANYMRIETPKQTESPANLWNPAPYLKTVYKADGKPNLTASDSAEYYKVIEYAYAVNLVKASDVVKQVTVTIYPNGSVYTYGGKTYDRTICTFTVPAGSTITLPKDISRIYWHNPVWRIYPQGSNNMNSYTQGSPGGTITVKDNIDIVPVFEVKRFRYNVNGGNPAARFSPITAIKEE